MGDARRRVLRPMTKIEAGDVLEAPAAEAPLPLPGTKFSLSGAERIAFTAISQQQQQLQAQMNQLATELCDRLGISRKTLLRAEPDGVVEVVEAPPQPS